MHDDGVDCGGAGTSRPRVGTVLVFAAACTAVIVWALEERALYLPVGSVQATMPMGGHGHGVNLRLPAPNGGPVPNRLALALLSLLQTVIGVALAARGVRWLRARAGRDLQSLAPRLLFALFAAAVAATVTIPTANLALGSAISSVTTLLEAMTVLQYAFVLAVAGVTLLGVP